MRRLNICDKLLNMEKCMKNQIITGTIDGYTSEGMGVCHAQGRAIFVPGTLRGESWDIRVVKVSASAVYGKAEVPRLLSPDREEPPCPYYRKCGGCALLHMNYEEELRFKLDKVNAAFQRIGRQNFRVEEIIGSDRIYRYRNKAIFAVAETTEGPAFGFYKARSHDLAAVEDCLLQSRLSCRAARAMTDFMREYAVPAYDESTGKGLVRHVFCRQAVNGTGAVACITAAGGFGSKTRALTDRLRTACPELTGIVLNVNRSSGNTVLSGEFYTLWGNACIEDSLLGLRFAIAPQAFFQINPPQAEKLYGKALEYAGCDKDSLALDLYCGAGTISLCLAKNAGHVIGAEIVPEAVENAKANALRNGVRHAEFLCADAAQTARELTVRGVLPDCIVTDPPRRGMEEAAIAACASMAPKRIVYVSCNPATLARDLLRFQDHGYFLRAATAVDMFPRTSHVECVALLTKEEKMSHGVK